jgi:hypothetical protein
MNKPGLVAMLLVGCALTIGGLGCGQAGASTNPTGTAPPDLTTAVTIPATTSTTTPPPTHWTKSDLSPEPFARAYPAMACDPDSGKVYLFGGVSGEEPHRHYYSDLWVFDPASRQWAQLHPVGDAPSARRGHAMVYDPSTSRVLLFGGSSANGHPLGDLWAYDAASNTWNALHPAGETPAARSFPSLAYDSRNGKVLLFGGDPDTMVNVDGQPSHAALNDLWSYDPVLNGWTESRPAGDLPFDRSAAGLAYDPAADKLILFGGAQGNTTELTPLEDLWSYDLAAGTWSRLHPAGDVPTARSFSALVYDPACGLSILFGGVTDDVDLLYPETLWAYDSAANTWKKLEPAGRFPYGRQGLAMIYDAKIGGMVLFGGYNLDQGYLSGTWTLTP